MPTLPRRQNGGLFGVPVDEVAFCNKVIVDVGVDGGEFLQGRHMAQPEHQSFSSSERQKGVFNSVVHMAGDNLFSGIAKFAHCYAVAAQPIGYDLGGCTVPVERLLQ